MHTPETSRLFTPYRHPVTGVVSHVLTHRQAPVQRPFYFTNPSYTRDGRYLWIECAFPPQGGYDAVPVSAVIDFATDELRVYHETQWTGRPTVDLDTGELYWVNGLDVWKRGPRADEVASKVSSFPKELARGGKPSRVVTHLTFSSDGKALSMDAWVGADSFIGSFPLDGSQPVVWEQVRGTFDHAQFSPTEPDVLLLADEYWQNPEHGPFNPQALYHRMYTIRRGGRVTPVLPAPITHSGHEWWDADGRHVWYVHYGVGIKRVDLATQQEALVWPGHLAHGQSDQSSRYLVADSMGDPTVCDCRVDFFDVVTQKAVQLVDHPPLAAGLTQCRHLHPHPHFCHHDRYVCYSTTVHGRVDVALTPTVQLREATAG